MSFAAFKSFERDYRRRHPDMRDGQSTFNALSEYAPVVAEQIRGTGADPSYNSDRLPAFWTEAHRLFDELHGQP